MMVTFIEEVTDVGIVVRRLFRKSESLFMLGNQGV